MFRQYEVAIRLARTLAAIEIQRIWRGYCVRKFTSANNSRRLVLTWRWGRKESDVYIAGDFSCWKKWKMTWLPCYRDYRLLVPFSFLRDRTTPFEFKFVVDGLWTCDGTLPMKEGPDGTVNNFFVISKQPYTPCLILEPFDRRSTSFPRLPSMPSFRYPRRSEANLHASHSSSEVNTPHSIHNLSGKHTFIRGV